ncbi:MAG TPA: RNB domain-containing ribonuclease, partial [Verrucomicrobiae bacterium]|nr:RNB domain-containing ribonuclease [Verrucomicrobiae bacterium]
MPNGPFDLKARARQAMCDAGFHPDFPADVLREAQNLKSKPPTLSTAGVRDMRELLWSSIDNDSSRDLDQVEYVEKLGDGTTRLLVGIADVDALAPKNSATDKRASTETTSVYTGVTTFPMLPNEFSTDATSLLNEQDRIAVVIELHVRDSGDVACHDVYPALLRNHAKLAYN